jgi:hypothetical protein
VPGFVNYKKGCTRLAAASDKVYQLLAHGRWFSPSTTNTGRHDVAESGVKHKKKSKSVSFLFFPFNQDTLHTKLILYFQKYLDLYSEYFDEIESTSDIFHVLQLLSFGINSKPLENIKIFSTLMMSSFTGQQKTVCFEFKGCRHFTVAKVLSKTSSTCPGYHPSEYAIASFTLRKFVICKMIWF